MLRIHVLEGGNNGVTLAKRPEFCPNTLPFFLASAAAAVYVCFDFSLLFASFIAQERRKWSGGGKSGNSVVHSFVSKKYARKSFSVKRTPFWYYGVYTDPFMQEISFSHL